MVSFPLPSAANVTSEGSARKLSYLILMCSLQPLISLSLLFSSSPLLLAFDRRGRRLRFRIRRVVRARSGSDHFRFAGALEEHESRTSLLSLWPAQPDPVLKPRGEYSRDHRF